MKKKKLSELGNSGEEIDEIVRRTLVSGSSAYGVTRKKITATQKLSVADFKKAKKILDKGISAECWRVKYIPDWARRHSMWLNEILFFLFNHNIIPFRWQKYL